MSRKLFSDGTAHVIFGIALIRGRVAEEGLMLTPFSLFPMDFMAELVGACRAASVPETAAPSSMKLDLAEAPDSLFAIILEPVADGCACRSVLVPERAIWSSMRLDSRYGSPLSGTAISR